MNDTAFPFSEFKTDKDGKPIDEIWKQHCGLTKREVIAAMALQGICARGPIEGELDPSVSGVVRHCIVLADELLRQLGEEQK